MVPSVVTEKKSLVAPTGIDPETDRLVAQYLNYYATPDRIRLKGLVIIVCPTSYRTRHFFHNSNTKEDIE